MSTPTPTSFGELLGLTQGIDAPPARALSRQEFNEVWAVCEPLVMLPCEEQILFYNKVAVLFLPSLLRTLMDPSVHPYDAETRWYLYEMVCNRSIQTPSFSRFVRNHPDEASRFFVSLLEEMARFPHSAHENAAMAQNFLVRLFTLVRILAVEVSIHLPPSSSLPSIDPFTQGRVLDLLVVLEERYGRAPRDIEMVREVVRGQISSSQMVENLVSKGGHLIWTHCESKDRDVPQFPARTSSDACAVLEEGVEMSACSRCFVVRYCSREHQKLDWKRHKLSCFEPSW